MEVSSTFQKVLIGNATDALLYCGSLKGCVDVSGKIFIL
jgi:hypothetical protein